MISFNYLVLPDNGKISPQGNLFSSGTPAKTFDYFHSLPGEGYITIGYSISGSTYVRCRC